jgi:hypothetical protein
VLLASISLAATLAPPLDRFVGAFPACFRRFCAEALIMA